MSTLSVSSPCAGAIFPGRDGVLRVPDGRLEPLALTENGMLVIYDVLVLDHLRIVLKVERALDLFVDEVTGFRQPALPLVAGACPEDLSHLLDDQIAVLVPGLEGVEPVVLQPLGPVHGPAHRRPVPVALAHGEGDPLAVGALVVVPKHVTGVTPTLPLELPV